MSRFEIRRNNNHGTVEVMDGTDILFSLQPVGMKLSDAVFVPQAKMKTRVVNLPLDAEVSEVRKVLKKTMQDYVKDLNAAIKQLGDEK